VNVFPFIEAEKPEQHDTVKRSCELLEVSRSAFYEWHKHVSSARQCADVELGERIQRIHEESRGTYGWPRVHRALRDEGVHLGREHVARIMRDKSLVGRCRRRWVKTTISDPDVVAVDLLKRSFGPGTVDLDRVYVGDITYIRTWEGWLYLATVIDLASRRVVGWAMADHMRADLVRDALRMAIDNRQPAPGAMFHVDRLNLVNTPRSATACVSPTSVRSPRSVPSVIATTTRSPRASSASTRPNAPATTARSAPSMSSSSRPATGCTGSTTPACTPASATRPRSTTRPPITVTTIPGRDRCRQNPASTNPGALQIANGPRLVQPPSRLELATRGAGVLGSRDERC
jgi:hypothetical protein